MHVGAGLVDHDIAPKGVDLFDAMVQPREQLERIVTVMEVFATGAVNDLTGQRGLALEDVVSAVAVVEVAVQDADLGAGVGGDVLGHGHHDAVEGAVSAAVGVAGMVKAVVTGLKTVVDGAGKDAVNAGLVML